MGFWLFISIFFAVGIGLAAWGISTAVKANGARHWPETPAIMESCKLVEDTDRDSTTWSVKVRYHYRVEERPFTGERITFGYTGSSRRAEQDSLYQKLKNAQLVKVHYNPTKPEESALGAGITRSNLFILIFAFVWLTFTTGFTVLWTLSSKQDSRLIDSIEVIKPHP